MSLVRDATSAADGAPVEEPLPRSGRPLRVTRLVAVVAGLVGFVASVLIPVLPVVQTTSTLNWPQAGQLGSVTAPLISLTPVSLTASVPCSVIREMPTGTELVLGTAPAAGKEAMLNGLFVRATAQRVDVTARNIVILSVPRNRMADPACQRLDVSSSTAGTFATVNGLTDPDTGTTLRGGYADPNLRPQIVGVFTDLTGPAPSGLSLSATIDTRFTSTPSPLKSAAMVAGILATVVGLLALWRLDRLDGRRGRRLIPARWRYFNAVDATVIAVSVFWFVAGAGSSDDGYQFGMANHRQPCRLHGELLPLVRQPRGPVRLVLRTDRRHDPCQPRQPVVAPAGSVLRVGVLALALPGGAAPTRSGGGRQPRSGVGCGAGVHRSVDAVQQRTAPRGPDRHRRPDHLRAGRTRHHDPPCNAGRAGDRRSRIHARHPAHRHHRCCRSAGRWASDPAHHRRPRENGWDLAGAVAVGSGRGRSADGDLRRPDHRRGARGHRAYARRSGPLSPGTRRICVTSIWSCRPPTPPCRVVSGF